MDFSAKLAYTVLVTLIMVVSGCDEDKNTKREPKIEFEPYVAPRPKNTGDIGGLRYFPEYTGDELLSRIKGIGYRNVMVIEFWKPKPGANEIARAYQKVIYQSYDHYPMQFFYLCLDCKHDQWIELMGKDSFLGYHICLTEGQSTFFKQQLSLEKLPYHMIIDQGGRVHKKEAPAPRTKEFDAMVKELFNN